MQVSSVALQKSHVRIPLDDDAEPLNDVPSIEPVQTQLKARICRLISIVAVLSMLGLVSGLIAFAAMPAATPELVMQPAPPMMPPTPPSPPSPPAHPPWAPDLYGSNAFADALDDADSRRASYRTFQSQYASSVCRPTGQFGSATLHDVKPYRLQLVICTGQAQTLPDGSSRVWVYHRLDGLPARFGVGAKLTFEFAVDPRFAPARVASAFYMGPAPSLNDNPPIYLHHQHARRKDRAGLHPIATGGDDAEVGITRELNFQAHGT